MSGTSAAAKNAFLDGPAPDLGSLHTAFPGVTGANELSGGGYTQQALTFGAASGGIRALSGTESFPVLAQTVRWIGFWDGAVFLFAVPNGGATPKNFVAVPSTDLIVCVAHGFADTDEVTFYNGTPPGGLTEGAVYFVRDKTDDTFKVAATSGGAAIDLTAGASPGCWMSAITEDEYVGVGTHTLSSASMVLPD
jgi:hypothetical protein